MLVAMLVLVFGVWLLASWARGEVDTLTVGALSLLGAFLLYAQGRKALMACFTLGVLAVSSLVVFPWWQHLWFVVRAR